MRVSMCVFSYLQSFNCGLLFNQETQQDKGELTETLFLWRVSRLVQYSIKWWFGSKFCSSSLSSNLFFFFPPKKCFKEVFEKHFLQMFIASKIPFLSLYLLQNTARLPTKEGLCSQEFSAFLTGVGIFLSYKGPLANSL